MNKYFKYADPNVIFATQNRKRLYLILFVIGILVVWLIWRKVVAKRPEDGADTFDDKTNGQNNTGTSPNAPYINGGRINVPYFKSINDLYAFLNSDGTISPIDAAHELRYVIERNKADWNVNGCDYINDLCTQLANLMKQSDSYIQAVNREYRRIYGNNINDDLPSFYHVFTCECDDNEAIKAKLAKLS